MLKFAANLTMLFNEVPFMERFKLAADAGFKGVEYLFPYAFDKQMIVEQLRNNGLVQVLHNLPAGNWEAGERGIACHPNRQAEFQEGVALAIDYAQALDCKQVNCLVGIKPVGFDDELIHQTLVDNLRFAATKLAAVGIRLLIEPINTYDIPGFYLNRTDQAIDLIKQVDSDNLFVQYDIYHAQRTEGELGNTISKYLAKIAHIQLADNPGRNEPGSGEINFSWLLSHIEQLDYNGWIGCEYKPAAQTIAGLAWIQKWRS